MEQLLQFIVTGLATGTMYALVGLGIALVFQVTGVINFAQGHFVMLGALIFAVLSESGVAPVPAAAVALAATTTVGFGVERLVIAPARVNQLDRLIILTIGAAIVIEGATLVAFGTQPRVAEPFTAGVLRFGGVNLERQYLWVAATAAVAVLAVWFFLTRTTLGKAMRGVAMDREAARLMGISPRRMSLLVFTLAAALGAVGGIALAPIQHPDPGIGIALGLKGFTAAVIGGLDWPAGAVAGGLLLGVAEAIAAGYLPSGYKDAVAYGALVLLLVARPTGLLRAVRAVRV
ncbi:MAG TPA: branched-chain amino acid ABC transporter permease [Micromonosporaceae bacterium]|nr:branched-chain amino acid ABC transporter permease [Micromonosporaceae bacterium]